MSETDAGTDSGSPWRIPGWYRRIGVASWLFLGIAAAIALISVVIAATSDITAPLVLGAFLALVFMPVVDWLADRGASRALGTIAVLVGLLVVLVAVAWLGGVALVDQADELTADLDSATARIEDWLERTPIDSGVVEQIRNTTADAGPVVSGGIAGQAISLIDSAFGLITGIILGTIVLYYLLKDGPQLFEQVLERSEDAEAQDLYRRIGDRTITNVQSYFRGRTALAAVNGVTIGLAALVLGVPAAGAIAVVNFLGAYIPYLGAFVGGAFAVLLALGEGGFGLALVILVVALAVNLLLENLLEPALLGDSLQLHPLLILLATSLGGMIAGMIGLILAAPALAIALDIERELRDAGFFDEDPLSPG